MANGLDPRHLLLHVIRPTLAALTQVEPAGRIDTPAARALVLGTAAVESAFRSLDQITRPGDTSPGPAFGLWQVERATAHDLWSNFLRYRPDLEAQVMGLTYAADKSEFRELSLAGSLAYGAALCRLIYWRSPVRLPADPGDVPTAAAVWKQVYNTPAGKGTVDRYIAAWDQLVRPFVKPEDFL